MKKNTLFHQKKKKKIGLVDHGTSALAAYDYDPSSLFLASVFFSLSNLDPQSNLALCQTLTRNQSHT
jgi:hypothetical protein